MCKHNGFYVIMCYIILELSDHVQYFYINIQLQIILNIIFKIIIIAVNKFIIHNKLYN